MSIGGAVAIWELRQKQSAPTIAVAAHSSGASSCGQEGLANAHGLGKFKSGSLRLTIPVLRGLVNTPSCHFSMLLLKPLGSIVIGMFVRQTKTAGQRPEHKQ
jgi:hypothetical protein